jgi:hypothetical protein
MTPLILAAAWLLTLAGAFIFGVKFERWSVAPLTPLEQWEQDRSEAMEREAS